MGGGADAAAAAAAAASLRIGDRSNEFNPSSAKGPTPLTPAKAPFLATAAPDAIDDVDENEDEAGAAPMAPKPFKILLSLWKADPKPGAETDSTEEVVDVGEISGGRSC